MKEKWLRAALIALLAVVIALGGYAYILRSNRSAHDDIMRIYADELRERLRVVQAKVNALPDATDAAYWGNMPDNRDFRSLISESRAILQVMRPLTFQKYVYDLYMTIPDFQGAVNYFTLEWNLFHYVYAPADLQKRIDALKLGIAGLE